MLLILELDSNRTLARNVACPTLLMRMKTPRTGLELPLTRIELMPTRLNSGINLLLVSLGTPPIFLPHEPAPL